MYNTNAPPQSDLPTSRQLRRSTAIALIAAIVILVTVVLPAEYAIDPTRIGRLLGLTEMGEIKAQLAQEAANDMAADAALKPTPVPGGAAVPVSATSAQAPVEAQPPASPTPATSAAWRDEMRVTLEPGQGSEVKLVMKSGEQAQFSWIVEGGAVNFDTHGDGGGRSISYEKGRDVSADEGVLDAAFDGNHGWFWRNRGASDVTVIIRARGQYTEMKLAK